MAEVRTTFGAETSVSNHAEGREHKYCLRFRSAAADRRMIINPVAQVTGADLAGLPVKSLASVTPIHRWLTRVTTSLATELVERGGHG